MGILAPVGDLGARHNVEALMANCTHQVPQVSFTWMWVRHDCFDHTLYSSKLNYALAVVRLIPEVIISGSASQMGSPSAQGDVEVDKASVFGFN